MDINEKEIQKADRKIDLSGFQVKNELNPKIWDKELKMKSEVRKNLLKIADDYFESLGLTGVDIEDVTMTGSLANYHWSKYSDVDLHIVIDYGDLDMKKELKQDFLKSKSSNWNKEHDVKIYGYDVELYVQDIKEKHYSTGIYSILNNEWNVEPSNKKIDFNDQSVKEKTNRVMDTIDDIYDEMDDEDYEDVIKRVDKLTEKIKKMRQSGLESGGEFSVENIVFKSLRRNGMLDRLYDIKIVAYDKSVTMESRTTIKESDNGDFDWLNDYDDNSYYPQKGDYIVISYVGGDEKTLRSWFHSGIDLLQKEFNKLINGESIVGKINSFATNSESSFLCDFCHGNDCIGIYLPNQHKYNYREGGLYEGLKKLVYTPILKGSLSESEFDDFEWTNQFPMTPISDDYYIRNDVVIKHFWGKGIKKYGEWQYKINHNATLEWFSDDETVNPHEIVFYATPYWDGLECLPIDYHGDMGDYDRVEDIELPDFTFNEELEDWLDNEYPKIVYDSIRNVLGY